MKQAGRISFVTLAAAVAVVILTIVIIFSRDSLNSVGARFMTALALGDVKKLTKYSYVSGASESEIEKSWEESVNGLGRNYLFIWRISGSSLSGPDTGNVRLQVDRNPMSYEENFQLPMIKVKDEWKVDVRSISRAMFPLLPR